MVVYNVWDYIATRTIWHKITYTETTLDSMFCILLEFGEPIFNSFLKTEVVKQWCF